MSDTKEKVKNSNIVRIDIVDEDYDYQHPEERIMKTYYAVNPDLEKLKAFKQKVERRWDDEEEGIDNEFYDCFDAVMDYIKNNFEIIDIPTKEIKW